MTRHKGKAVVKYAAAKQGTAEGRALAKKATQGAAVYRACLRAPRTFAGILAAVAPKLRGKKKQTILDNTRWYVSRLKRDGFLRRVKEKAGAELPPGARVVKGHLVLTEKQARAEKQPVHA